MITNWINRGWLNRHLAVWRPTATPDGAGGQTTTFVRQPDLVRAKVDQPAASERMLAQQAGTELTHSVYLLPDADVRRGDELRDPMRPQIYRVLSVVEPSSTRYRKADCRLMQPEGTPD